VRGEQKNGEVKKSPHSTTTRCVSLPEAASNLCLPYDSGPRETSGGDAEKSAGVVHDSVPGDGDDPIVRYLHTSNRIGSARRDRSNAVGPVYFPLLFRMSAIRCCSRRANTQQYSI